PRRAWEPVRPIQTTSSSPPAAVLRYPRSHAPRGNATVPARTTTPSVGASYSNAPHSSFPRSGWECNRTSKDYHAERGSQLFQRSAFLVPTLRVGAPRYQQGLPRRAWEPVIPTLRIPRSHAPRGSATVPARTTTPSVGASYSNAPHSSFPCSVWECNGTSKDYHAERGSQLFQRSAFLVPTLRVGMQRYQQGLPRRASEPVRPIQTTSSYPPAAVLRYRRSLWHWNSASVRRYQHIPA